MLDQRSGSAKWVKQFSRGLLPARPGGSSWIIRIIQRITEKWLVSYFISSTTSHSKVFLFIWPMRAFDQRSEVREKIRRRRRPFQVEVDSLGKLIACKKERIGQVIAIAP
jgi:hypothetical protein